MFCYKEVLSDFYFLVTSDMLPCNFFSFFLQKEGLLTKVKIRLELCLNSDREFITQQHNS